MFSSLFAIFIAWLMGGEFSRYFFLGLAGGLCFLIVRGLSRTATAAAKRRAARRAERPKRHGLVERWKDETRRMNEKRLAASETETETKEGSDEMATYTNEQLDWFINHPEWFAPARDTNSEDEAFAGIDRDKEAKRLARVLEGLYTRRDRMLYTYGCMDGVQGNAAKEAARARLEKTKAWRGLQFDIEYTEKRLALIEA